MQFIAMQASRWISNPLPDEQNTDASAAAKARKRGFCECGSQVGCSLERPTAQVENFNLLVFTFLILVCVIQLHCAVETFHLLHALCMELPECTFIDPAL